jgi:hypothetical protein
MFRLEYRTPTTARFERKCERCQLPLYSGQPMAVSDCAAREMRGCGGICLPDETCSASISSALHVGCAVLRNRGER